MAVEQTPNQVVVTVDDLRQVPSPSPQFKSWLWDTFYHSRLDVIVGATISAGLATTVPAALEYLGQLGASLPNQPGRIALADLKRSSRGHHFSKLESLLTGRTPQQRSPHLRHGQIGHQAMFDLITGNLETQYQLTSSADATESQFSLFADSPLSDVQSGQLGFFAPSALDIPAPEQNGHTNNGRRKNYPLHRIETNWDRVRTLFTSGKLNDWQRSPHQVRQLVLLVSSLFPEHAQRLKRIGSDPDGTLTILSLLSWAAAAIHYHKRCGSRALFRELAVLNSRHHLGGGRIDALDVRSINGKTPSKSAQRIINSIAASATSTGCAIHELVRYFKKPLELVVIDWKFLIGDIIQSASDNVTLNDLQLPLKSHLEQMERYLTLITLDYHLSTGNGHTSWQTKDFSLHGELVYIMPHRQTIIHPVHLTPDEREQNFTREIVLNFGTASHHAQNRMLSNFFTRHLLQHLEQSNTNHRHIVPTLPRAPQEGLFNDLPANHTAHQIIEQHRQKHHLYVDTNNIIEMIGMRQGKPRYGLHFDTLYQAINDGKVTVGHFSPTYGGKISCLMPKHDDPNPSMQLYLTESPPRFHCFGCGASGIIIAESIPEDILADIPIDAPRSWRSPHTTKNGSPAALPVVPEEHHRIMCLAQELLLNSFTNSPGERYLSRERCIDPDIARSFGIGFGDDRLINGLLDSGYTLDQLIHYGFIGISNRVSSLQGIVPLLRERGLSFEEIRRPCPKTKKKETTWGFPYSVLRHRVTAPLGYEGRLTNFYGRAIYPCSRQLTHRKLSVKKTRVEQGGFNLGVVESATGEIFITEAVIDALSLVHMGYRDIIAVIGIGNDIIARTIAYSQKNIAIALDNDKSGREGTEKFTKTLTDLGYRGSWRNFTEEFVAQHKEGPYKDFNKWWEKYGSIQQT